MWALKQRNFYITYELYLRQIFLQGQGVTPAMGTWVRKGRGLQHVFRICGIHYSCPLGRCPSTRLFVLSLGPPPTDIIFIRSASTFLRFITLRPCRSPVPGALLVEGFKRMLSFQYWIYYGP